MNQALFIESFCSIKNNQVIRDGELVYQFDQKLDFPAFAKALYEELDISYSKFYKMDNLSKLTFLTTEILLEPVSLLPQAKQQMAILLTNRSASLDTDRNHQKQIDDLDNFYPSPAVFVYTLPNIGLGEISIRHKLHGQSGFFVFDTFNADFLFNYLETLYKSNKCTSALCGWTDFDDKNAESFLYLVSQKQNLAHTVNHIQSIYTTNKWKH